MLARVTAAALLLQLITQSRSVQAQNHLRGANQKVRIVPKCDNDKITVQIVFAPEYQPHSQFTDWIIVGENGRSECRRKGNGELIYVVEISVTNDPCGTKMTESGVFQNSIRIAQFPGLILQDDSNFTFKCVYGLPEVEEFQPPQVNPTFDVKKNLVTDESKSLSRPERPDLDAFTPPVSIFGRNNNNNPTLNRNDASATPRQPELMDNIEAEETSRASTIQKASNNLLAILLSAFVILAVLVFLLVFYVCLRQWQARHGGVGVTGDKGHINVDSGTPSPNSPGVTNQDEDGPWWSSKSMGTSSYFLGNQLKPTKAFESNKRSVAPNPESRHPPPFIEDDMERAVDVGHLAPQSVHRQTEVFNEAFRRNGNSTSTSQVSTDLEALRTPQSYAEWREKVLRGKNTPKMSREPDRPAPEDDAELAEVRSITEIYKSAETRLQKMMHDRSMEDDRSDSSVEGEYSIPVQRMPMDKKSADILSRAVESIRGFGANKLTEQEISRWRQLITTDTQLQTHILQARTQQDLRAVSELADYRLFFTRTKWGQIMACVFDALQQQQPQHGQHLQSQQHEPTRHYSVNNVKPLKKRSIPEAQPITATLYRSGRIH